MAEKFPTSNEELNSPNSETKTAALEEMSGSFNAEAARELAESKKQEKSDEAAKQPSPEAAKELADFYAQHQQTEESSDTSETSGIVGEKVTPYVPTKRKTLSERYDEQERERVDRLKRNISYNFPRYQQKQITKQPSALKKAARLFFDKLGIRTNASERRREYEAMHIALTEYQNEKEAEEKAEEERRILETKAAQERHEAEKARKAQQERERLEADMVKARSVFDYNKQEKFQKQRAQEALERNLNSRLLTVDTLEEEVAAENPEVQKRTITYEGTEIPVYDLKGLPFITLSTTIDYRKLNKPGEIGTETYRKVMDDPSTWTQRRDEAEKHDGFGTRNGNAMGDTISTSYRNSEHNMDSYVRGELIYGFAKVEADSVIAVRNGDGGTSNMAGRNQTDVRNIDEINHLEGAHGAAGYNEILLRRYSENGFPKRPDYIIATNGVISEAALRHAKYFGVPIINIDESIYYEKNEARGKEILDSISDQDSYEEIDRKISELQSISPFRSSVRTLKGIGRESDDLFYQSDNERDKKCLEVSKMERIKRLEYLASELEKAAEIIEEATKHGEPAPKTLTQFRYFSATIYDVQNSQRVSDYDTNRDTSWDAPGNPNRIEIDFRLNGSTRLTETSVYDGEHPHRASEAIERGFITQKEIDNADSSYYRKLEPIVRRYLEAAQANRKVVAKQ